MKTEQWILIFVVVALGIMMGIFIDDLMEMVEMWQN